MDGNKDEAQKCLAIAQQHYRAGNISAARKFCQKSISLFEMPQAIKLLASLNADAASSSSSSSSSFAGTGSSPSSSSSSGTQARASSSTATNRAPKGTAGGIGGEKRDYTPEQHQVVKRVKRCKVDEYYEILEVKEDCEEMEIKRAYRKVRLIVLSTGTSRLDACHSFRL
jgi:DnaJ homolog subfamily B member 12